MARNVSEVEHLYRFGIASTVSDDLATQVLFLTQNMRILMNKSEQWDDVYDEIEKDLIVEDVTHVGEPLLLSFTAVNNNMSSGSDTINVSYSTDAVEKKMSNSSAAPISQFDWTTAAGSSHLITVLNPNASDIHLLGGVNHLQFHEFTSINMTLRTSTGVLTDVWDARAASTDFASVIQNMTYTWSMITRPGTSSTSYHLQLTHAGATTATTPFGNVWITKLN